MCGSSESHDIAMEYDIAIARCRVCRLIFTRTPVRDSQSHYAVSRATIETKYGRILGGAELHPRTPNYTEHLYLLEAITEGRSLLDVGTHCGFFLDAARRRGWRVSGVEPSPVTSAIARERFGLDVRTGTLDGVALPPANFDVVTLVDVFEHIGAPRAVLRRCGALLRPGGRLFIKVPNARYAFAKYLVMRPLGLVDDAFDAREHLVHYTPGTLRRMLRTEGFQVEIMRVPSPIQVGSYWRRVARAAGPGLAKRLPRGFELPLATDLCVVARPWPGPRAPSARSV